LDRLSELLKNHGIGYLRKKASQAILNYSPIKARALLHMARNIGSSAFSEVDVAADKEKLMTKKAMSLLKAELTDKCFQTYGQ
jgi:hypothetical protein